MSTAHNHDRKPITRDEIRAKIFGARPETRLTLLYGAEVEVRQPYLEVALAVRSDDRKEGVFRMMLDYTYVPGTEEKLFDDADIASLGKLPMGKEFNTYMDGINDLLGVTVPGKKTLEEQVTDATKSSGSGTTTVYDNDGRVQAEENREGTSPLHHS